MKLITKINKAIKKVNEFETFDEFGFTHKREGINEGLIVAYKERAKTCKTFGEVCDFNDFAYMLCQLLKMPMYEVKRYLRGSYRDIFWIEEACGLNHIELKNN